ncbi:MULTISPECIES: hypothetical protein [unclassified Nocardioides]|uniref:hypothetical protein n=1 Tax=unclassified Nocardioides TaxID=2615069 RepID=UPI003605CD44
MTSTNLGFDPNWVPDVCTLPTVEQPLRLTEFDDLFITVTHVDRAGPTRATLTLAGWAGLAAHAQDLADREKACCSFFSFTIVATARTGDEPTDETRERVRMSIEVPEAQAAVLAALVDRAEQRAQR